ncbi:MAG: hypothetical protein Q9174_004873 [Haloplaca sp. 1 TL-2023]
MVPYGANQAPYYGSSAPSSGNYTYRAPPSAEGVGSLTTGFAKLNPAEDALDHVPEFASEVPSGRANPDKAHEKLDPDYIVRNRPHDFFTEGRVFMIYHTESAGNKSNRDAFGFTTVSYGETVYSQFRRFVVVKAKPKEFYCICVPITTYGGRATGKKGVDGRAHAIVYTGNKAPLKLKEERGLVKDPLRVLPSKPENVLDPKSRINLGKPYPIEWNIRVKDIGRLDEKSRQKLIPYWRMEAS